MSVYFATLLIIYIYPLVNVFLINRENFMKKVADCKTVLNYEVVIFSVILVAYVTLCVMLGKKCDNVYYRLEYFIVAVFTIAFQFVFMLSNNIPINQGNIGILEHLSVISNLCIVWTNLFVSYGMLSLLSFRGKDNMSKVTLETEFNKTLSDIKLREEFVDFLKKEFSLENLMFYEKVNGFENQEWSNAMDIYEEYVKVGSNFEINLPVDIRKKIDYDIQEEMICAGMFSEAKENIKKLMIQDSFRRFFRQLEAKRINEI